MEHGWKRLAPMYKYTSTFTTDVHQHHHTHWHSPIPSTHPLTSTNTIHTPTDTHQHHTDMHWHHQHHPHTHWHPPTPSTYLLTPTNTSTTYPLTPTNTSTTYPLTPTNTIHIPTDTSNTNTIHIPPSTPSTYPNDLVKRETFWTALKCMLFLTLPEQCLWTSHQIQSRSLPAVCIWPCKADNLHLKLSSDWQTAPTICAVCFDVVPYYLIWSLDSFLVFTYLWYIFYIFMTQFLIDWRSFFRMRSCITHL